MGGINATAVGVPVSLGEGESPSNDLGASGRPSWAPQAAPEETVSTDPHAPLAALCLVARFHQIACEQAILAHTLGIAPTQPPSLNDVLLAAKHVGLKARLGQEHADQVGAAPVFA